MIFLKESEFHLQVDVEVTNKTNLIHNSGNLVSRTLAFQEHANIQEAVSKESTSATDQESALSKRLLLSVV